MVEQWATNQEFWSSFPFGWLSLIGLSFMLGLIVEDATNDDSWIWKTFRSFSQFFVIEVFTTPYKTTPDNEWLEVFLRIRVVKNIKKADIVLTAHSCMNVLHAREDFILEKRIAQHLSKGETIDFTLGSLPIKQHNGKPPIYSSWGRKVRFSGDVDGMHSLHVGTDNIVDVEVRSGYISQKESVFIAVLKPDAGAMGRVFLARKTDPSSLLITPNHKG